MTITIVLLTYAASKDSPRAKYAKRAISSVLQNLYTQETIAFHIADDGSYPGYVNSLVNQIRSNKEDITVTTTNAQRAGYGASYNLATQVVHQATDFVLPLEDDWVLEQDLWIDNYLKALRDPNCPIECIRLGYLGFTQPLRGTLVGYHHVTYLSLDPESPERHVSAGHPRIETVQWERFVGPWAEGLDPGTTEFEWCGRPQSRLGVAWPMSGPYFSHIGTVQARGDQHV